MASKMPQVLKVTKMEYRGPPGKKKLVAKNLIRMSQDEMYCQTIPTSATMLRQRRHRQEVEATSHLRLRQTKTSKETMQLQGMYQQSPKGRSDSWRNKETMQLQGMHKLCNKWRTLYHTWCKGEAIQSLEVYQQSLQQGRSMLDAWSKGECKTVQP
jgi:hypothetical protein